MNDLVTPFGKIREELTLMQNFLQVTLSEEAEQAYQHGNSLVEYLARSGKLFADARFHRDNKRRSVMESQAEAIQKFSPSVAVKYVESLVAEEEYAMLWAERIHRTCTHQLDWCRSVLSKAKEEIRAYGNSS